VGNNFFLEIHKLKYAYRKQPSQWILDDIDLRILRDEFLLICGASGSGKSTLCRTFNGLIPHFYGGELRGDVFIAGVSTSQQTVSGLFRQVGMVFQNPETQLFNNTVEQEIVFGLESLGLSKTEIESRVSQNAEAVHISHLLFRNPHELSGGEQQLVSIAAILALKPQLLILDEPYANLDHDNVRKVREILQSIHRQGTGVVICEHRLPYTVPDVERMAVLQQGRIVMEGQPHDLLKQHNMEPYGLELPLATHVGQKLGMDPVPLSTEDLIIAVSEASFPSELQPLSPEPLNVDSPIVMEVANISFAINRKAILHDISFSLRKGECLAIVGANGAGKTVLLKHLNGLYRASQGEVRLMGKNAESLKVSQLARLVGIAFQNPNSQFFKLNVWDEIAAGPKALNCYDEEWLKELVALFHLEPLLERAPFRLSGGEKKRVAFAAALAAKPVIFALDEPTAGQGWYFRRALGKLLTQLRRQGQAIILVTHDLAFAEAHAHRWLLMAEGQVVAEGTPRQIMANQEAMRSAHLEPTDAFRLFGNRETKYMNDNEWERHV